MPGEEAQRNHAQSRQVEQLDGIQNLVRRDAHVDHLYIKQTEEGEGGLCQTGVFIVDAGGGDTQKKEFPPRCFTMTPSPPPPPKLTR